MGMLSLWRSAGDCRISFAGASRVADEPRLHVLVLGEEVVHVADEVLDQRQVRQRLDVHLVGVQVQDVGLAGQPVARR